MVLLFSRNFFNLFVSKRRQRLRSSRKMKRITLGVDNTLLIENLKWITSPYDDAFTSGSL